MYTIYQKSFSGVKNAGFTLIELLVVVLIIGILAAVGLPQYQKAVEKARCVEASVNLKTLVNAEELFKLANGVPTFDFDNLDISIPGKKTPTTLNTKYFTYRLQSTEHIANGYEVVAQRLNNSSALTDYYLYYRYDGLFLCVARQKEADPICSALCSAPVAPWAGTGYTACLIS